MDATYKARAVLKNDDIEFIDKDNLNQEELDKSIDILLVRDTGFIQNVLHEFNVLPSKYYKLILVNSQLVKDNGFHLRINKHVDFMQYGNIWAAETQQVMQYLTRLTMRETNEHLMEMLPNYARKLNWMDQQFSQLIQRMDKKTENIQDTMDKKKKSALDES